MLWLESGRGLTWVLGPAQCGGHFRTTPPPASERKSEVSTGPGGPASSCALGVGVTYVPSYCGGAGRECELAKGPSFYRRLPPPGLSPCCLQGDCRCGSCHSAGVWLGAHTGGRGAALGPAWSGEGLRVRASFGGGLSRGVRLQEAGQHEGWDLLPGSQAACLHPCFGLSFAV